MKEGVRFQNEFNADTHKKAKFVKTIGTKVNDCIIQNGNFFCGSFPECTKGSSEELFHCFWQIIFTLKKMFFFLRCQECQKCIENLGQKAWTLRLL